MIPSFYELWDSCIERYLMSSDAAFTEFEGVLRRQGITSASKILDTCSGGGSLDIELLKRGYNLATMDGDMGMLELFRRKLGEQNIVHEPKLVTWQEIPRVFESESFDAMMCCGNSLIYAGGYWNGDGVIDQKASLKGIREVLGVFRRQLNSGGVLLVDKPMDDERPVEELVARLCVAEKDMYDVFFSVRFDESRQRRTAQILLRHQGTGKEIGVPNVAYHLQDAELENLFCESGFSFFERIVRGEHDRFPLWIARV